MNTHRSPPNIVFAVGFSYNAFVLRRAARLSARTHAERSSVSEVAASLTLQCCFDKNWGRRISDDLCLAHLNILVFCEHAASAMRPLEIFFYFGTRFMRGCAR